MVKRVKTQPFVMQLSDNKIFVKSINGGGVQTDTSTPSIQSPRFMNESYSIDVLSINNYFEDSENGDMYIYGLFNEQEKPKKMMAKQKDFMFLNLIKTEINYGNL